MNKLRVCPLCGHIPVQGTVRSRQKDGSFKTTGHTITCKGPGHTVQAVGKTYEEVATIWNARHLDVK